MPFTPFHFGPSGFVGLAFRKWIDLPVFVLANVAVDFEPGIVLLFALDYPVHGFCHTFLIGAGVGLVWAFVAYWARGVIRRLMHLFGLGYETNLRKVLVSAVLGVWFHVFLDSFCWSDVQPFWPLRANPFLDLIEVRTVYQLCILSSVPAILLYVHAVLARYSKREQVPDSRSVS